MVRLRALKDPPTGERFRFLQEAQFLAISFWLNVAVRQADEAGVEGGNLHAGETARRANS
jgi:hypothetical protein